jgi:hypothetical protein
LKRPENDHEPEPVELGNISKEQLGVEIQKPLARGLYELVAHKPSLSSDPNAAPELAWDLRFTVNGEGSESDLSPLSQAAFEERVGDSPIRWVGPGETISLAGAQISGQNAWKWMILLVLLFLLVELAILAWPTLKARAEEAAPAVVGSNATAPTN